MPDILMKEGHLNKLVKKAVELGMSIENAVYCSTFTPARRMNLKDRGALSPGKLADFILLDDTNGFKINSVYKDGKKVYCTKEYSIDKNRIHKFPGKFYNSIKRESICRNELKIKSKIVAGSVSCRIINVKNGTTFTDEIIDEVNVKDGYLDWENSKYCLIAVFERYGKNNNIGLGLIAGDTIKKGAVAASYAHDHHNIISIGRNIEDMVKAVNSVISSQGGYFVVEDHKIIAGIELPIGGILSELDMESIGSKISEVTGAMRALGYEHYNPVMSLSTIGLPVSQLLKITDKGLIRVDKNKIVDIFMEEQNEL
jgi:adenine deaminase